MQFQDLLTEYGDAIKDIYSPTDQMLIDAITPLNEKYGLNISSGIIKYECIQLMVCDTDFEIFRSTDYKGQHTFYPSNLCDGTETVEEHLLNLINTSINTFKTHIEDVQFKIDEYNLIKSGI